MGCGLRKMKPVSEENSPGKIYSTLKRPQVETKVGVAYTYRYLDFLIGKDGGTSTLRLSSVRELPGQLQELYQQGFVLASVHPFIHPCGPESNSPQHQLYRAILIRLNDGAPAKTGCTAQSHRPAPPPLHMPSSPEPLRERLQWWLKGTYLEVSVEVSAVELAGSLWLKDDRCSPRLELWRLHLYCHNPYGVKSMAGFFFFFVSCRVSTGVELLALYNHPPVREGQMKYYTVKVPLRVQNCDEGVKGVEANWLDHMTQHFNNGASLVDGYFHLGNGNDMLPKSVESVFIFQEASEVEPNAATPTYDAIVVEQWTVINGLQVKADYVPLLQSLATYGWRLTCVLPTPVIKTNSDGSLSTKQIVFLQRPILGRKKRESKKLIFKPRSKSNKNCIKDTAKNKKKKRTKTEKDADDPKIVDDREKVEKEEDQSRDERVNAADVEAARESETSKEREVRCEEDRMIDDGIEISIERKDGGAETEDKGAEHGTVEEGEEKIAPEGVGTKETGEPLENGEVQEVTEIVATVEARSETKEKEGEGVAEAVIENGVETDEEKDEGQEIAIKRKTEEPAGVDVIAKEITADSQATPAIESQEKEE
ncbi:raftlin [Cebidichthys violaceus]|uniref:raftlin n=1 Tax=Cebidichthys violaceus TaxID=271503 RepID=UPI0035C9CBCC